MLNQNNGSAAHSSLVEPAPECAAALEAAALAVAVAEAVTEAVAGMDEKAESEV